MKTCFKCQRELPRTEFYRHPAMGDGLLGKCKDCTRDDVTENRIKNIGRIRQYDRERAALPHRKAQTAVGNAVRDGRLRKPNECQRCGGSGETGRIEAHHPDYSKPLEVEWLCKPCHAIADKERRAA